MATHAGATSNLWGQTGTSFVSQDTTITAGYGVVVFIGWESAVTISGSVTDDAGQTYTLVKQQLNTDTEPNAAIYYKASHPGGSGVNVTVNFSGSSGYGGICVMPFNGGAGGVDGTPTSSTGGDAGHASSFTAGTITTTGVGFAVQWLVGFQALSGVVTTGSSPAFTRDTVSENGNGGTQTAFAQYYLSGSAQTIQPGCGWGAATDKYSFIAAAFKDSAGSGATLSGSASTTGHGTQVPSMAVPL